MQNDEALFGSGLFNPSYAVYNWKIFGHQVPILYLSYLGALKSWLYFFIFKLFAPTLSSIRVPMLTCVAGSVALTYLLVRRASGTRAATIACVLLATDATYLLSGTMDWGPVALQHLFLLGGALLVLHFHQTSSNRALAFGFFLFGLGLWDKALGVWMLSGLGIATLALYPKIILHHWTWRRFGLASAAFLIGALPLLAYNVKNQFVTFRGNTTLSASDLPNKFFLLRITLEGPGFFGWMIQEDDPAVAPAKPRNWLQKSAVRISTATGAQRTNLMLYGFAAALILAPLAGWAALRGALFCLIAIAVAWFQMALNKDTGGSLHHTILLWPFPQIFMALVFAGASRRLGRFGRPAAACVLAVLAFSNLLVMNEYYVVLARNGGAINWTSAMGFVAEKLRYFPAHTVFVVDWGILDSVRLLDAGAIPLRVAADPLNKAKLSDDDQKRIREWLEEPDNIFVNHTPETEFFPGSQKRLDAVAAAAGFARQNLAELSDKHGRKTFVILRYVRPE